MSCMPASTNTSASPTFAQQMPTAPRSICHVATMGDLWVLACGRSRRPADEASSCTRATLRSARTRSIRTCGVGRSERRIWWLGELVTWRIKSPTHQSANSPISRGEQTREARGAEWVTREHLARVVDTEMAGHDLAEDVAEVGGHREVAAV